MEMICDTNYDKELYSIIEKSKKPDSHYSIDLTRDTTEGWFH
jgi:hypothetical protein